MKRLQRGLRAVHSYFLWDGGNAYDLVLLSLRQKLYAMTAHFRRSAARRALRDGGAPPVLKLAAP